MIGNPANSIGWVCECGERLDDILKCPVCSKRYKKGTNGLVEIDGEEG
jgi:UDP-2-acetamido-3-amino-2,3-dideoxy-glucuronate N-acetyltransferase